jgi:hypothetical protein
MLDATIVEKIDVIIPEWMSHMFFQEYLLKLL